MDLEKLYDAWAGQTEKRNAYKFAVEEICLDAFAELVKDTFEAIKLVKNQYLYNAAYPEDPHLVFDYLHLIAELSQYSTYDYDGDESEDFKFTATCLVAQALVRYVIYTDGAMRTNGKWTFFDNENTLAGEFVIIREDYPYFSEECQSGNYIYNVYKGDFREVLELAKELAAV